ncbi:MAG: trypsin-like peptidase domain-containing protein [Caldilineaceae bacterium]|nr:trypsin-like peptidase domain-containing protein [Caldilineaceae bacterium]
MSNEQRTGRVLRQLLLLAAAVYVLGGAFAVAPAVAVERIALLQALKATVQVLVPDNDGELYDTGSGTIMDADTGLILTNFHVMGNPETGRLYNNEGLAVLGIMAPDLRGAPVLKYVASVVQGDPKLDLIVLKVVGLLDDAGAPLPRNLGLSTVPRGNSDDLLPGDRMAVLGYPGLGGATVTYTEGVVSGFLDEDGNGEYEWIKTDTEVNPGNSGGLAIDFNGAFIGVPTAGYSRADVAGKISLVRPATIALGFYDEVVLGEGGSTKTNSLGQRAKSASSPSATFGPIVFAAAITDDNKATDPKTTFSDIQTVYAVFSVSRMADGTPWSTRWLLDGEEVLTQDGVWDGGSISSTWVSLTHPDGLPVGAYRLELYIDGKLVQQGDFSVEARTAGSRARSVNVTGVVYEADNSRRKISGALIVFLKPGVSIQSWIDSDFDDSKVHASGTSARDGVFQLDAKVTPGERYSVVVIHDDYEPVAVDFYPIPADTADPYELDVAME